jgi:uncharacterized RDD family membrane protein YckC
VTSGALEEAGLRRRALALLIDAATASLVSLGVVLLLHGVGVARGNDPMVNHTVAELAAPLYLVPQWALGRTVGMRLLGLELVRQGSGTRPGLARASLRLLLWVIDLGLEMLPFLLTATGDLQKRAPHDLLSGTVIIRVRGGRGRFWERGWTQWLAEHHDERRWIDRAADLSGRHTAFVAGSNRRVATILGVAAVVYGAPVLILLLDRGHPLSAPRIILQLASMASISGFVLFLRYRLKRPGMVKIPSPARYRLAGWFFVGLSAVATTVGGLAGIRGSWLVMGLTLYVAVFGVLLCYVCLRSARIFADPSRRLPPEIADKVRTFPVISPIAEAHRVTLVLADGRRIRRVMVAYGGLVLSIGRWRMSLDFRPADTVDAVNEVRPT